MAVAKYHKPINKHQLGILSYLYKFRFVTAGLLAEIYKKDIRIINSRLKILLDQEYIGRNYDSSYRIKGKQASYYLLAKGIKVLSPKDFTLPKVINTLYKDKNASEDFINHQLVVLRMYNELERLYPGIFDAYSRSELKEYTFEPPINPDLYLRREKKSQAKPKPNDLFLNYTEAYIPFYKLIALIRKYLEFAEQDGWDEMFQTMPNILIITETELLKKRLKRRIARELENSYADILFNICSFKELTSCNDPAKLWTVVKIDDY